VVRRAAQFDDGGIGGVGGRPARRERSALRVRPAGEPQHQVRVRDCAGRPLARQRRSLHPARAAVPD
jgi:hypothetical protein